MAAALRPAVSGATPRSLRRVTSLHSIGLLFGAVLMALLLALARSAALSVGLGTVLIVPAGIALALAIMQLGGLRLPQSRWQVPEYWRRTLDADVLPIAYGAILGFGVFTAVVVGAFWVFLAATLLYGVPTALIGWAAYALGRAIGFRLALQVQPVERIFLTALQHRVLIVVTTVFAALVVLG